MGLARDDDDEDLQDGGRKADDHKIAQVKRAVRRDGNGVSPHAAHEQFHDEDVEEDLKELLVAQVRGVIDVDVERVRNGDYRMAVSRDFDSFAASLLRARRHRRCNPFERRLLRESRESR